MCVCVRVLDLRCVQYEVIVQTKRQKELSKHMLPEEKLDFSSMLRSTMPGKVLH